MAKTFEEPSGGLHNVLATGTLLTGTIVTESDFRVDGRVDGEINCKGKIVIGTKGIVKGNITTVNAEIFGTIEGSVKAYERLILKSTAVVKGDIFIQTLEIEPGACLNGSCTMSGKEGVTANTGFNAAANVQKPK
ncbi:MAG: polymer-forming cytoskeletal protein [Tannerella sp.]|jgi:cytoskeletal protein CcmA (bactofilin family)|nr:polymer-forming cytoskeletal protein [Tannerella sp.]